MPESTSHAVDARLAEQMHEVTALVLNGPLERFRQPELATEASALYAALGEALGRGR